MRYATALPQAPGVGNAVVYHLMVCLQEREDEPGQA